MNAKRSIRVLFLMSMLVIGVLSQLATAEQTPSCTVALLVIDVQNIWLRGPLFTTDHVYITDKIATILPLARGASLPVIYIKDVSRSQFPESLLSMPHAITPIEGDYVSEKQWGNAFLDTGLDALLQELGVDRLLISGLASNSCVEATVDGALLLDYEVIILADAHTGGQSGVVAERMNQAWLADGLLVVTSTELDWQDICLSVGE